eukprot:2016376-Rhodomonas_salina.2
MLRRSIISLKVLECPGQAANLVRAHTALSTRAPRTGSSPPHSHTPSRAPRDRPAAPSLRTPADTPPLPALIPAAPLMLRQLEAQNLGVAALAAACHLRVCTLILQLEVFWPVLHSPHPSASCLGASSARSHVCPRAAAEVLWTGARTVRQPCVTAQHLELVDEIPTVTALRARRRLLEPLGNALTAEGAES